MKILTSTILMFCVSICSGQNEIEAKFGFRKGIVTSEDYQIIKSLENREEGPAKFEYIIELLDSDSTENIIKVYMLEKYLSSRYMYESIFVNWLLNNLEYEIDKNVYEFNVGLRKDKYPILYFLIGLEDSNIFNEEDLLKSAFLSNCELFEDSYTKMFTCKLMAEYFMSSGKHKSILLDIAGEEECRKKNFDQIMKFCF